MARRLECRGQHRRKCAPVRGDSHCIPPGFRPPCRWGLSVPSSFSSQEFCLDRGGVHASDG
eukprot:7603947-Lingulodinium_polyedra.AAC.1